MSNPFGNSLQFNQITYPDQLNSVAPPVLQISAFMPAPNTVTADGLTLELWFKASSSGSLVSVPMSNGQAPVTAPLIYIDTNGLLRAGLFDSSQITLYSGQNLIAQNNNGVINVGAPNTLHSPLSVIDGEWHHAALVVQPGPKGTQSLYLDGRLAGSSTGNGSFGLSFVSSDGTTWDAQTPTGTTLGGSITPEPIPAPTPFPSLAQGFCGCLNELRTWYGPRSVSGIQQLIDEPLALNFNFYQDNEGLAGYVGAGVFSAIQPTAYLVTTSDAPPVDPFTDVTNRVPGFQNFGICMAIPFTTAAPEISFQASQTYNNTVYETLRDPGDAVWFAAVAASDMPPSAIVTLEPSALSFGDVTIGSSSPLTAVLTNTKIPPNSLQQTQQKSFQNISATSSSSAFVVTAPTEVQVGQIGTVIVTFEPGASDTGPQSGTITITGQGQWNSISLTLACSGTGVQST